MFMKSFPDSPEKKKKNKRKKHKKKKKKKVKSRSKGDDIRSLPREPAIQSETTTIGEKKR